MRAVVQGLTCAVDLEPMPVIRLNIVFVHAPRRRALPEIPVKLLRYWRFLANSDGFSHVAIPGFGVIGPADQAIVYLIDDLDRMCRRALLRAHLHKLAVLLLSLHKQGAFGWIMAAWLLNVNMLAHLQAADCHGGMPVIGSSDCDCVYILLLQDVAKILVHIGGLAQFALSVVSELLHGGCVHVAKVRDPGWIF